MFIFYISPEITWLYSSCKSLFFFLLIMNSIIDTAKTKTATVANTYFTKTISVVKHAIIKEILQVKSVYAQSLKRPSKVPPSLKSLNLASDIV